MKFILIFAFLFSPTAIAAIYVSSSSGNDSKQGTTPSSAWKTIKKVNSSVRTQGTDVYFRCGDTWKNEALTIDWGGTINDRVNIGSYYLKNGTPILNNCPDSRPHIQGSYAAPDYFCGLAAQTTAVSASAVPGDFNSALVKVQESDYVTVQDIYASRSAGRAFMSTYSDYVEFKNNEAFFTCGGAIFLHRSAYGTIFRNVFHANVLFEYLTGLIKGGGRPACVEIIGSPNAVVESNTLYDCYMENIGIYDARSKNVLIRDNLIHGILRIGIYFSEGRNGVAENNILVGQEGGIAEVAFYDKNSSNDGSAFALVTEDEWSKIDTTGNIIRNNLIANVAKCIRTSVSLIDGQPVASVNNEFYGNTCIGATQIAIREDGHRSVLTVKNNIFIDYADDCNLTGNDIFEANYWGKGKPSDSHCVGDNDVYGGTSLNKTSGWDSVGLGNIPRASDFVQKSNSTGLNAGVSLTRTKWTISDFPPAQIALTTSGRFDYTLNSYDYTGSLRDTPPDIGAIEDAAILQPPPTGTRESIPYYQAPSSLTDVDVSSMYKAKEYITLENCTSFVNTTTLSIANTTDDLLFQAVLGCDGAINIDVPIPNGTYDFIYRGAELYYGLQDLTPCNANQGVRSFDIYIEGLLVDDELNICKEAGAPGTALSITYSDIKVSDGVLNVSLIKGTSTVDGKPIISGFDIIKAKSLIIVPPEEVKLKIK